MKADNILPGLLKWHFYLLGFILLDLLTGIFTGYRLNQNLIFFFKLVLYLSGAILFFRTLKPFKITAVYFSFYIISTAITGLFLLFGGIFLAIMSSILLYPIYPKQTTYKNETIKVYNRFQGFFSRCCSYEVVEPKLYFFEKRLGVININKSIAPDKDEFRLSNNVILYKHENENYDNDNQTVTKRDTTEIIPIE
ncbi:hypothetical protein [Chitinophaga cymbidii]|uniref:hypothetical protein n=1 Tax=Chitinophaga cymbidii TaxID=1096750 RepID=UPI0011BD603C|nr:hypothetical protein [Chitinophaga cymbidii]